MLGATAKYAIRAVAYLATASEEGKVDSVQISEATGIPRQFLQKILHTLKMSGYLSSARGIGGGFGLMKSPDAINLYEIATLFEDLTRFSICPFGVDGCRDSEQCPLHEGWSGASAGFLEFLRTSTFERFREQETGNCFPELEN